jgi:peptide/nickel transport system substrate-binding protein
MVSRKKLAVSIGVVAVAAVSLLAASWAGASSKASYPRTDSLITAGTQWGTIAGFNPYGGSYATGMVGLVNETLLRYDPLKDKYINWLAKSAKFTGKPGAVSKTFVIKVRPGIKWSSGQAFTAKDVVFNIFTLGKHKTASWNVLWQNLKSAKAKGDTVTIQFKTTPNYDQWFNLMYTLPMMNPTQYAGISDSTWTSFSPADPIGTGPYTLGSLDATTRIVWQKKATWWAAKAKISPSPAPQYIIDLCNDNNTTALSGLLTGILDLDNNYIPGINKYVTSGDMQTYFPGAPYNLPANTAWLTPNLKHPPLNDPKFRKALATSLDVSAVVNNDYHNLVTKANPTGLLKVWNKWIDTKLVKKYGFTYSTSQAKSMLAAAGYKTGSDGYVVNKDGSKINLKIAVPSGWSDWETAEGLIVNSAKAAGIHITIDVGDFNHYALQRNAGQFDLVIDNTYQISDNPFTYFNGLFHLPIIGTQTFANFSRYTNKAAWKLVLKLDKTPLGATKTRKSIMSALEKYELTDVPNIPMWYNGVWAQTQSKYWTNWPSSTSSRQYIPASWRGYLNMTAIDMYTHVKKA